MSEKSIMQRVDEFMKGRYGSDELGNAALYVALILIVLNLFVKAFWLGLLALIPLAFFWWRMMSTDIEKRQQENAEFVKRVGPAAKYFILPGQNPRKGVDAGYSHLICPQCGQAMRVPTGKGRMRVTCPRCNSKFETRS